MEHCSIGQVHALQSQCRMNRWIVLVGLFFGKTCYTEVLVLLVWGYSSIRVSHAELRSACWVRSDETDWGTQLPPHMGALLFYFTLTSQSKVIPHLANLPQQFICGAGGVWSTNCSPIFLYHDIFGWCVRPPIFKLFVSLDLVPTLPLKESFEESGIRVGWPAGPLRNPALFSN